MVVRDQGSISRRGAWLFLVAVEQAIHWPKGQWFESRRVLGQDAEPYIASPSVARLLLLTTSPGDGSNVEYIISQLGLMKYNKIKLKKKKTLVPLNIGVRLINLMTLVINTKLQRSKRLEIADPKQLNVYIIWIIVVHKNAYCDHKDNMKMNCQKLGKKILIQ